jgi:hypothetical protein
LNGEYVRFLHRLSSGQPTADGSTGQPFPAIDP